MEPFLYHGIRDYNLERLISILDRGFILPRKMLPEGFRIDRGNQLDLNGESWISICQKSLYDERFRCGNPSSFEYHIKDHICAVINPTVEGIKYPSHVWLEAYGKTYVQRLINDDSEQRYSTYMDELQTRVPIPTSKFIAIGYPKVFFETEHKERNIPQEIDTIRRKLDEKGLNIPIVDSSYDDFADTKEHIKKLTIK